MRIWRLSLLSLLLLALGQSVCAHDADYILSRSYYEDKTNALSFAQVQHEQFTPYQQILTGGYSAGTYWLKLRVLANAQALALKIRPVYTEEIQLFDPASTQPRPPIGFKYPWSAADLDGLSYNFVLPPSVTDRDVYLKVKSIRSYVVYAEVMPLAQYHRIDRNEQLLYAVYVAFTLILAVWLLIIWLMNRELVLGIFTMQQFFAVLHGFLQTGFARTLLDGWVDASLMNYVLGLVGVLYPTIACLANKLMLQEYGLKSSFKWGGNCLLVLSLIIVGIFLAGQPIALKLNAVLVLVAVTYFWLCALFGINPAQATFKAGALPIVTLRVFYSFNLILWLVAVLPLLAVAPAGEITLHSLYIYNLISALTFFFLLQHRAKLLFKLETERSSLLKLEVQQERQQREEQGMLMAMLSHEIKTPLSVLQLVVDEKVAGSDLEGHANRAVNNINLIVERCLQLGKLDAEAIRLNPERLNCQEFLSTLVRSHKAENRVCIECAESLATQTDPDILRVVMSNLVENALKYAPVDSQIAIEAEFAQRHGVAGMQIVVANDIGMMGAPDPEQVFKKYYRNTSATRVSGSGLGLFLVHQLVDVLGGEVVYQPEENRVAFVVWMPT